MYRKRDGISVFHKSYYNIRFPIKSIKYFFQNIKYCYQRIRYGWCDSDTWDIDLWFLNIVPPMLQYLRDNKHGYPADMEEDEWDHILETMIKLFTEADEDLCSQQNEYHVSPETSDDKIKLYMKRLAEISEYRNDCKNKAFDFFKEYFWNLCD